MAGVAAGASYQESETFARDLPGIRVAQLAARSRTVHAALESAGAGKRRGAAQSAEANSATRFNRDELRAAAPGPGSVAKICVSRRDPGRGAVHQEPSG